MSEIPREIYIIHMQRSGGHAIAGWINAGLPGNVLTINDVGCKLTAEKYLADPVPAEGFDWIVVTAEDRTIKDSLRMFNEGQRIYPIGRDPNPIVLIVLRDPWNLFASRAKMTDGGRRYGPDLGATTPEAVACWKDHARWFSAMGIMKTPGGLFRPLRLKFNDWFQGLNERRETAEKLGIEDGPFESVAYHGTGSSFDGLAFDGRASEMKVLERYREFPPEFFLGLFDEETWTMGAGLFDVPIDVIDRQAKPLLEDGCPFDLTDRETLMASLPRNTVGAEIGVQRGNFARKILELARPRKLFLIDCWKHQASGDYGVDPSNVSDYEQHLNYQFVLARFSDLRYVHVIREFSLEAAGMFADGYFDWLDHDANHLEVVKDVEAWLPKVKEGGWVFGHDFCNEEGFITVKRDMEAWAAANGIRLYATRDTPNATFAFQKMWS